MSRERGTRATHKGSACVVPHGWFFDPCRLYCHHLRRQCRYLSHRVRLCRVWAHRTGRRLLRRSRIFPARRTARNAGTALGRCCDCRRSALSATLSAQLALASGLAFLFSELADFAVYSPLRQRHWLGAVVASNTVGVVVDSALFLWLAFGSLEFLAGQVVGKLWMTALAVTLILTWRRVTHRSAGSIAQKG